jgi:arylsulfatase A-like enzyme
MCKKRGGDVSEHMRNWLADIKGMDDEIGILLKRLDDLNLRDNTIVVFTSDQGPESIREADNNVKKNKGANDPESDGTNYLRLNAMGFAGPFRGGRRATDRLPQVFRYFAVRVASSRYVCPALAARLMVLPL